MQGYLGSLPDGLVLQSTRVGLVRYGRSRNYRLRHDRILNAVVIKILWRLRHNTGLFGMTLSRRALAA
jgi:hypothetical protein